MAEHYDLDALEDDAKTCQRPCIKVSTPVFAALVRAVRTGENAVEFLATAICDEGIQLEGEEIEALTAARASFAPFRKEAGDG